MNQEQPPPCPVCGDQLHWDPDDKRWECVGMFQHCFKQEGSGFARSLVLVATDSGEDAELYEVYPWPDA